MLTINPSKQNSGSKPSASRGGARRRAAPTRSSRPAGGAAAGSNGILRFYTDEAPGLRIGPTTVLVLSLLFIASVVVMHMGKFTILSIWLFALYSRCLYSINPVLFPPDNIFSLLKSLASKSLYSF